MTSMDMDSPIWRHKERSFASFIVCRANRDSHALARQAALMPGQATPLVIVGPQGCGTTHLAAAICQEIAAHGGRICWFSLETISRLLSQADEAQASAALCSFIAQHDVLALDDAQFLLTHPALAARLAEIVAALPQQCCQVLITCSDDAPATLTRLQDLLPFLSSPGAVITRIMRGHDQAFARELFERLIVPDTPGAIVALLRSVRNPGHVSVREMETMALRMAARAGWPSPAFPSRNLFARPTP